MSKCNKCGKFVGFWNKRHRIRWPPVAGLLAGLREDTLCEECHREVMDQFKERADADGLVPIDEPKCSDCYYFLHCENLAADPPRPMTCWPRQSGVCNVGQRKPFTMTPSKALCLVKESDAACYQFEQARGETKNGWVVLG